MYSDADEILQEEINQYKVRKKEGFAFNSEKCVCGGGEIKK